MASLNMAEVKSKKIKVLTEESKFIFEKLTFKSTPCYGDCPYMLLEINNDGMVYFNGKHDTGKMIGSFEGTLKTEELNRLISMLEKSKLDSFPENLGRAIDAPVYYFIIHYNGKTIHSTGYHVPDPQQPLLDYLLNFYKTAQLKKSKEEHTFELQY